MKAIEAQPIDRERAKTDVAYFAEQYLDIKLTNQQIQMVEMVIQGKNIVMGGRRNGASAAASVAIAMARRRGLIVEVKREPIDVST